MVSNKGHLLTQYKYFIGPVNVYYEVQGRRVCVPRRAGDPAPITPYVPHSFTSRDKAYPDNAKVCLLYTSPSPRDLSTSRMPSSA